MKRCGPFSCWTDYPFVQLGDTPGQQAPMRQVWVMSYDGDKRATVSLPGLHIVEIKGGYLYRKRGRYGQVKTVNRRKLERMKP